MIAVRCIRLLVVLIFIVIGNMASAQTEILSTASNGDPLPIEAVNTCQDTSFINQARIGITDDVENLTIDIVLPSGIEYTAGSFQLLNTNPNNITASYNGSNGSTHSFKISPSTLTPGDYFTIEWGRQATCEAIAAQQAGDFFKDNILLNWDGGFNYETNSEVRSYDLLVAAISIAGEGPIVTSLGASVERDITFTNGGLGELDVFTFFIVDEFGTETNSLVTVPGNTPIAPSSTVGDTTFYTLSSSEITQFGNSDNHFQNGEQIVVRRNYTVTECDNASGYGSYWGCDDSQCQSTTYLEQSTVIENVIPNLEVEQVFLDEDYCYKGQSSSPGGSAVVQTFKMTNTGNGLAKDIFMNLNSFQPGSNTGFNYFESSDDWKVKDQNGNYIGVANYSNTLSSRSYRLSNCVYASRPSSIRYSFDDIEIPAGEYILVEVPTYVSNISCVTSCVASFSSWYSFSGGWEYKDQCQANNYGVTLKRYNAKAAQIKDYLVEMPTDLIDQQEFTADIDFSRLYSRVKSSTEGYNDFVIDLSSTSLVYNGGAIISAPFGDLPVTVDGDEVIIRLPSNASNKSGVVKVELKADCDGQPGGTQTVKFSNRVSYNGDDACSISLHECLNNSFQMHCPSPCPRGGATPKFFTLERISYGEPDNNDNGVPDTSGAIDKDAINVHRAVNGDTILGTWNIYVNPNIYDAIENPNDPNSKGYLGDPNYKGNPFNYTYVEFDLRKYSLSTCADDNDPDFTTLFTALPDAKVTVYPADGGPAFTCTVTPTLEDDPNTSQVLNTIAKYDFSPCKATWEGGDSIVFEAKYIANASINSSGFDLYISDNDVYSSYIANPTGHNPSDENKYTCDHFNDYMNILRIYNSPYMPNPQDINGCTNSFVAYLRQYVNVQANNVWFPNEYRNFTVQDRFVVEWPAELIYRSGSAKYNNLPVDDSDVSQVGNQLIFSNLSKFFVGYGGTLLAGDEVQSRKLEWSVDPSCDAEVGAIYNAKFYGENFGNGTNYPSSNVKAYRSCDNEYSANISMQYDGPLPFVSGGGNEQISTDNVTWQVFLNNGSNSLAGENTWFYINDLNGTLNDYTITQGGNLLTADANGFYQIGENPAGASVPFIINGTVDKCIDSKVELISGFNCSTYPTNINGLTCAETVLLESTNLPSEVQVSFIEQPVIPMDLCEQQPVKLRLISAQAAYLDNPQLSYTIPTGVDVPSSINVEYPEGSGNIEALVPVAIGNELVINLEQHSQIGIDGVPGTIDALTPEERAVVIDFTFSTDCDFLSGDNFIFKGIGSRPCGSPAINSGVRVRTVDLDVAGVNKPFVNNFDLDNPTIEGCKGTTLNANIQFVGVGSSVTNEYDSVYITLQDNLEFIEGTFNCTSPNACLEYSRTYTDINGDVVIVLNMPEDGIDISSPATASFTYEVSAGVDDVCGDTKLIDYKVVSNLGNIPCSNEASGSCPSLAVTIGEESVSVLVQKRIVKFDGAGNFCNTPTGAELSGLLKVENIALAADEAIILDVYCADASGNESSYVSSVVVDGPIGIGQTKSYSGILSNTCNPLNGLVLKINRITNNNTEQCNCEDQNLFIEGSEVLTCSVNFIQDVQCADEPSGSATVVTTGGNGSNSFLWDNGETTATATMLDEGEHTVTVTDANNCSTTCSVTILGPSVITTTIEDITTCEGEISTIVPIVCEQYLDIEAQRPLANSGWNNIYGDQRSALIGDGELCFTIDSLYLNSPQMLGLNNDPHTSNSYTNIDYALYIRVQSTSNNYLVQVRENASTKYSKSNTVSYLGSTFCLRRTGTLIEYLKDGEVFFTSTKASNDELYYDHSVYSGGGTWANGYSKINNIKLCGELDLQYNWNTGESTSSIEVSDQGTYTLEVTDDKGCKASDSAILTTIDLPEATVTNDGPITCYDSIVDLRAYPAGLTYLWDDGSTEQIRKVSLGGTYSVTVTNESDCSAIATSEVTLTDPPVVSFTGDKEVCLGEVSSLSPNTGGAWSSSNTDVAFVTSSGVIYSSGSGTAIFTFTDGTTGCSTDSEVFTVVPELTVQIDNNGSSCIQDGSQLTAVTTGGLADFIYNWEFPDGTEASEESVNITLSGDYSVTVTDAAGCTAETSGYIYSAFEPYIFSLETSVCEGEMVNLDISGSNITAYAWDSNAGNATTSSVLVTPSAPSSTYIVTVTNINGCTSTASATIEAEALPIADAGADETICENETVIISTTDMGGNNNYAWFFGSDAIPSEASGVGPHEVIYNNPNQNGANRTNTVTLTVTNGDCTNTDTKDITVKAQPSPSVSQENPSCGVDDGTITFSFLDNPDQINVLFSIDGGITFPYTTNDNVGSYSVSGLGSGIYDIASKWGDDSCIVDLPNITLADNTIPTISNSGNDILCIGATTIVTASTSGTWISDNSNIATVSTFGVVQAISAGVVNISFVTENNCPSATSLQITVTDKDEVTITGSDVICDGATSQLIPSKEGGTWSSNNTNLAIINSAGEVTGVSAGIVVISYNFLAEDCTENTTFEIEVFESPTAYVSGTLEICEGETTNVNTNASGGFWTSSNNDIAIVSSTGLVTGLAPGDVTFYYTNSNECPSPNTETVTVTPEVSVAIDFNGSECLKDDSKLSAIVTGGTANYTYLWTGPGGFTANTQTIDVVLDGNYTVLVSDAKGCTNSTSAFVYEAYEPFIFALSTSVCEGEPVTLSVNGDGTTDYLWSGSADDATTQSVTVIPTTPSSVYVVTVTNTVGCTSEATAEIFVDANPTVVITGPSDICIDGTTQLTPTSGGFWISSNAEIATITDSGLVTGLSSGSATFTFTDDQTGCSSIPSDAIIVNSNSTVTITGNNQICFSDTPTLMASESAGIWSSDNLAVATISSNGVVTPVGVGSANITFSPTTDGCFDEGVYPITINNDPTISLNGPSDICEGANTFAYTSTSGTWYSSDESVATISPSGVITGVGEGSATISFETYIGCVSTLETPINVLGNPEISLNGPSNICVFSTTSLSPTSGGIWISSNNNVASINSNGVVTANSPGVATFSFIESTNGCTSDETITVTVSAIPEIGTLSDTELCIGETANISPSTGGTWMSTDESVATISNSGLITSVGEGFVNFKFVSEDTGCESSLSQTLLVNGTPMISYSGPTEICQDGQTSISPSTGGTWVSTDESVAIISQNGIITGVNPGSVSFIYTNDDTGCTSNVSAPLTVNSPSTVMLTGPSAICVNDITNITPNSGGTWSSSDDNIASITNAGVITGHNPGAVTFTFTSSTACVSDPSIEISVMPKPITTFTGPNAICIGSTTNLSPNSGGVWTSSNTDVATVDDNGLVTAIGFGNAEFTFIDNTTGCESTTNESFSVYTKPETEIIGDDEICIGSTTFLTPSSGGLWTSSNPDVAVISSSGQVTGVSPGIVTFTFDETGSSCISDPSMPVTVYQVIPVSIEGNNTICIGETTTLSPTTGGTWVSNNLEIATVSENGIVTAVSQGAVQFTFISNTGCESNETAPVIVNGNPTVLIDGPDQLCIGDQVQMSPSQGGTWVSNNPDIASIDNNGLVTAISDGEVNFTFENETTGCISNPSDNITVNPVPNTGNNGPSNICVGTTTFLTPTTGGVWTALDPNIATIQNNGQVLGVSQGNARFIFTQLNTGCESEINSSINVESGPEINYTGPMSICVGENTAISAASIGVWESTDPQVAIITNDGIITGLASGSVKFIFTESGSSCTSELSETLTVHSAPSVFISGSPEVCVGTITTLSPDTGGTWVSLNPEVATITSNGIVTGVAEGSAYFVFTDDNTGCVSDGLLSVSVVSEIEAQISGDTEVCTGYTTTLSPSSGGYWTSSNPAIATVSNLGVVTGLAPGIVTFTFTDGGTGCSSGGTTEPITVFNCINHDFNVALVDQVITGDVNTNDNISDDATYSNLKVLVEKPSLSNPQLTINVDGTYSFVTNVPGKYIYDVPVCLPPMVVACPTSILEINVLENVYGQSNPLSNLEFATTYSNTNSSLPGNTVTINPIANDDCVYTVGCDLDITSLSIINAPENGAAVVSNGEINYTPNPGYIGQDTIHYQVCESTGKCSTSSQVITINAPNALNTVVASDDFAYTLVGVMTTGNVMDNDTDPENDNILVTQQGSMMNPVSIPEGEYYINNDGSYGFTPNGSFDGALDLVYTLCDDNIDVACTNATLHIQVFGDLSLNIRMYIEGALMQNGDELSIDGRPLMRDGLRVSPHTGENYIPIKDPYTYENELFDDTPSKFLKMGSGLLAENLEITDSLGVFSVVGDNAIVDWVHVELRSKTDNKLTIATRSGLLQRDGDVVDLDGKSALRFQGINTDSFYVCVRHRTHLGVMSDMVSSGELIDFTLPSTPTFNYGTTHDNGIDYTGLTQKSTVKSGYLALWAGDFNSDGLLKFTEPASDINILYGNVLFTSPGFLINYDFTLGYFRGDYNMDGKAKYANPDDDRNFLQAQIIFHPLNVNYISNLDGAIQQVP